ncbi:MAG: NAD-dependent epimerase/dehydratase family protein [Gammaproteobacteria bacterium]|nr:NAD-dependent epimerase/dehydratase family protein [Gammaproteobacteria bacterium]MCP5136733.1 NAD-dependent epimerase/dehydratase family protein [Gammaproteobacteria bacterium]
MSKILVTGAAGFLGFALAKRLSDDPENQVFAVDNFIRGEDDEPFEQLIARDNVEFFQIDLTLQADVARLPTEVDYVYHLAALNGTQNFYERPFEVVKCCTLPTIFLIEHYKDTKLQRFIYAGTSEAYASTVTRFGWEVPTSEEVPVSIDDVSNARWSYGGSKIHGEVATINGCRNFDMPYSIIRFHNAYGPRMGDKHVIPDFFERAKKGVYELYGYEDTRSFMYVDDCIEATLRVGESDKTVGETVNVGSEHEITILELGKAMLASIGVEAEITLFPSPVGSVKRRAPNVSKLKRLTGFEANWALDDGLRMAREWYYD